MYMIVHLQSPTYSIFLYFCIVLVIQDSNSFQHGNPDLRVTHQSHRPTVTGFCGKFCLQWPSRFLTH